MKVPVILYDIDSNPIPINAISKSNSFFIRSFQKFQVQILESEISKNIIYSVSRNPTPTGESDLFIIDKQKSFLAVSFFYTIYIESNCTILVKGFDGNEKLFNIRFEPDNVLTEEQEHYSDLLTNNKLPTFEELEPAIIDQNKADLIKRLLLDFKYIIKKKGTKTGITKFLNLIGFDPESIKVYEEFQTPTGSLTIAPNKEQDFKTGNYHVLFDNWTVDAEDKWTNKNLPKRIISIENVNELFEKLWYALSLANIYFTLPEQDITFFGISFSANIEKYLSIAGNTTVINQFNVHNFQKDIKINIYNQLDVAGNKINLVSNNIQKLNVVSKSSVKTFSTVPTPLSNELYLTEREIYDGEIVDANTNISKIKTIFGNILHIKIESPETYFDYTIENVVNPFSKLTGPKILLTDAVKELILVTKINGRYKIILNIYDKWNNRERYIYFYDLKNVNSRINIKAYNSAKISETINELALDVESSWNTTNLTANNLLNYVLPLSDVPENLKQYYDQDLSGVVLQYLSNNKRFKIKEINKNWPADLLTRSIPVDYLDNWLEVIAFKYDVTKKLCIKIFDGLKTKLIEYHELGAYPNVNNNLFITAMDVAYDDNLVTEGDIYILDGYGNPILDGFGNPIEAGGIAGTLVKYPYIFITTTEPGINISKSLYDLVLVPNNVLLTDINNPLIKSIYELTDVSDDYLESSIPINYDFPLFFRPSLLVPAFINYPVIDPLNPIIIKSLYPRLADMSVESGVYNLRIGDVLVCIPDDKYISGNININWKITNAFNNKILFETTDYMLKYRITENTVYNVTLEFYVENTLFSIVKKSLVSSFELI